VLSTGDPTAVELATGSTDDAQWLHCRIGAERDATGQVVSLLMSARDITELKRAQHVVSQQALTDSVTGLANRNLLTDRVRQALVRLERRPGHIALLFVDLDRFKEINDTHGHHVGDEVLCEIAHRLQVLARRGDTVARLGGDEFVILCDGIADPGDARAIASRAVSAAAEPIRLLHGLVQVSASVGVVVTGDPRSDPAELLRSADAAMYRAKRSGRNAFRLWDRTLDDGGQAERGMESELLGALDRAELRLAFQPLLSLGDRSVQGFEALIRWQHPTRGLLAPGDFLPSAEASGVMDRIGAWVLDAAVAQLASWSALPRAGTSGPLTMAVNVSGAQLRAPGFSGLVAATLRRHDVAPQHLVIEVAEHALAQDALTGDVRDVLIELTALGVRLAVDDFGMRYTSLARLPTLPVSIVKLDRVTDDTRAQRIAAAVVAMAHGLGMSVVGEGIETAAQLRDLVDLSVDDGQGFLLGHPVDGATAGQLLSAHGG
jgi:diguanylate cyclase (GGDEF)-like protein